MGNEQISRFVLEQSIRDGQLALGGQGQGQGQGRGVAGVGGGEEGWLDGALDGHEDGAAGERSVWDALAAKNARMDGVAITSTVTTGPPNAQPAPDRKSGERVAWDIEWDTAELRNYVLLLRATPAPLMTAEGAALLQRYYQLARLRTDAQAGRATVRLLESLVRLSTAHAKLCWRGTVTLSDAVVAVYCVHASQTMADGQASFLGANELGMGEGAGRADFPADPQADYEACEGYVFSTLNYTHEMLARDVAGGGGGGGGGGGSPGGHGSGGMFLSHSGFGPDSTGSDTGTGTGTGIPELDTRPSIDAAEPSPKRARTRGPGLRGSSSSSAAASSLAGAFVATATRATLRENSASLASLASHTPVPVASVPIHPPTIIRGGGCVDDESMGSIWARNRSHSGQLTVRTVQAVVQTPFEFDEAQTMGSIWDQQVASRTRDASQSATPRAAAAATTNNNNNGGGTAAATTGAVGSSVLQRRLAALKTDHDDW